MILETPLISCALYPAVLWIRIRFRIRTRMDPHHFGIVDQHPDPHPHQIKIRIRIKISKLHPEPDPDPHQFADDKPKFWNMSLF